MQVRFNQIAITSLLALSISGLVVSSEDVEAYKHTAKGSQVASGPMAIDFGKIGQDVRNNIASFLGQNKVEPRSAQSSYIELDEIGEFRLRELAKDPSKFVEALIRSLRLEEKVEIMKKTIAIGIETSLKPIVSVLKTVEKYAEPEGCALRTVCRYGSSLDFIKEYLRYLSPELVKESDYAYALTKGISGLNCEEVYSCSSRIRSG